jgi:glycerol kinase
MANNAYLGIDQGSSSTKAVLIDETGKTLASMQFAVPPRIEEGRQVEQDADGLLESVVSAFKEATVWAAASGYTIGGAGIALQRSGVVAWSSRSGKPLGPMMTWADTRTQRIIDQIGRGAERISVMTGIPTIANFAAGKIHLLQRGHLDPINHVGTLDSFLVYKLTNGELFITEETMAARTMLYALADKGWNERLCRDFAVDQKRLAKISPSITNHFTHNGVPVVALIGDQQAALLGRTREARRPLLNLGTIASLAVATGSEAVQKTGLITSVLFSRALPFGGGREVQYLVEATSSVTGAVLLEPLRRGWALDSDSLDKLCKVAAETNPPGLATAYFVNRRALMPNFPDGVPNVTVCKPGATEADRARAVVENVGNLIVRMLEEFQDKGLFGDVFPAEIDIAGGGSEVDYLMQYIADVSGYVLHRMRERDASARGAALCAWMQPHNTSDISVLNQENPSKTYRCVNPERRRRYMMWQRMEFDVLNRSLPAHAEIE